jgi:hypothetical protein
VRFETAVDLGDDRFRQPVAADDHHRLELVVEEV